MAEAEVRPKRPSLTGSRKRSFAWVTGAIFLVLLTAHWVVGWFDYVQEQSEHHSPVVVSEYLVEMGRGTLENWQSEFVSILYQVIALSYLYYAGSPQSRGDDERMEEMLQAILRKVDPEEADSLIRRLEAEYPKD